MTEFTKESFYVTPEGRNSLREMRQSAATSGTRMEGYESRHLYASEAAAAVPSLLDALDSVERERDDWKRQAYDCHAREKEWEAQFEKRVEAARLIEAEKVAHLVREFNIQAMESRVRTLEEVAAIFERETERQQGLNEEAAKWAALCVRDLTRTSHADDR
jgi:hypothetical protein